MERFPICAWCLILAAQLLYLISCFIMGQTFSMGERSGSSAPVILCADVIRYLLAEINKAVLETDVVLTPGSLCCSKNYYSSMLMMPSQMYRLVLQAFQLCTAAWSLCSLRWRMWCSRFHIWLIGQQDSFPLNLNDLRSTEGSCGVYGSIWFPFCIV